MIRKKQLLAVTGICLFVGLVSLTPKPPKSAGAPAERTGAATIFSSTESTCQTSGCHDFFSLNSGNGILTIECVDCDGQYKAGSENLIRVSIKATGFDKFGFQAVVLKKDSIFNVPVGEPTLLDPVRTQILEANNQSDWMKDRRYVTHTFDGNVATQTDSTSWEFTWVAPENYTDTVTFYVAALTADNDLEMTGDYVYTATLSMGGMLVGINPNSIIMDLQVFPNPVSDRLFITTSQNIGPMQFKLYDLNGKEVCNIAVRANEEITLSQEALSPGLYMYSLEQGELMLKQGKIAIQ